jgi:hypothetical protein
MATVLSSNPSLSANYVDCLLGCGGVGAMPLRYASNPLVLRPWLVFVLLLGPFPEEQVITNANKTNGLLVRAGSLHLPLIPELSRMTCI